MGCLWHDRGPVHRHLVLPRLLRGPRRPSFLDLLRLRNLLCFLLCGDLLAFWSVARLFPFAVRGTQVVLSRARGALLGVFLDLVAEGVLNDALGGLFVDLHPCLPLLLCLALALRLVELDVAQLDSLDLLHDWVLLEQLALALDP